MKPSIFANIAFQDYISDKLGECPTLSASIAHTLLTQSPRHAWFSHPRLNPAQQPEEAEIADIGSVAHHVLLAGDTRAIVLIDAKDYRTNAAKEARDAARAGGGIPLLQYKLAAVNDMVIAAKDYLANSEIAGIFDDGAAEQTILWQEMFLAQHGEAQGRRQDGVWCRARPDWLSGDKHTMLHYKTTAGSAEPGAWIRSHLALDGYDVSLAFYERGLSMFEQKNRELRSIFLIQEQEPPYACSLVGLDPAMQDLASRKVNRAINLWADCLAKDRWPAYPGHIAYAEPAAWMMQQQDERDANEAYDRLQEKEGLQP